MARFFLKNKGVTGWHISRQMRGPFLVERRFFAACQLAAIHFDIGHQFAYQRLRTALGDGYSKATAYVEATKGVAVDTSGLRFAYAFRRRVYLCSAADILRTDLIDEKQLVLTGKIETLNPDVARVVLHTVFRQRKLVR
ncbi:hypothetical protein FJ945_20515 [Mesorhizobium sp. B2-4-9]|uniref:hypothetical protein n=1 Tax=Mesorhizobium sp. B2-4-9 TaxID=2589940 RepID=UPI001127A5EA|nr:hypothetical protein [Mesorhizobium sp. B2-4-9]TPL21099.1 hypothetical protein FJ945_20515 [Mesorhizobium sp. B2-4-9]